MWTPRPTLPSLLAPIFLEPLSCAVRAVNDAGPHALPTGLP